MRYDIPPRYDVFFDCEYVSFFLFSRGLGRENPFVGTRNSSYCASPIYQNELHDCTLLCYDYAGEDVEFYLGNISKKDLWRVPSTFSLRLRK